MWFQNRVALGPTRSIIVSLSKMLLYGGDHNGQFLRRLKIPRISQQKQTK